MNVMTSSPLLAVVVFQHVLALPVPLSSGHEVGIQDPQREHSRSQDGWSLASIASEVHERVAGSAGHLLGLKHGHGASSRHSAKRPKEAGWFGNFNHQESTYTEEGMNAELRVKGEVLDHGWSNGYTYPFRNPEALGNEFFHESPSAGFVDAWQTHYPAVSGSVVGGREVKNQPWRYTPEGWVQDYLPSYASDPRDASWFDTSVSQLDGYGRQRLPDEGRGRRYEDYLGDPWIERAVNTTIQCSAKGCSANTTLQPFNPTSEEAAHCMMNMFVHATDFDDDWSNEAIENLQVNNYLVKAECDPMARGCNSTAARPLYSCLRAFPVDSLMDATGTLFIKAKLSKLVDECPYNGNLLSGVVMASCLVRPKQFGALGGLPQAKEVGGCTLLPDAFRALLQGMVDYGVPGPQAESLVQGMAANGVTDQEATNLLRGLADIPRVMTLYQIMTSPTLPTGYLPRDLSADLQLLRFLTYGADARNPLTCNSPGCTATTVVYIDPTVSRFGGTCFMNISLNQTDFDDPDEKIEYINLDGQNITGALSPGLNPCKQNYQGVYVAPEQKIYIPVSNYNVTGNVLAVPAGTFRVTAQLSDYVDECASNGHLLDAEVVTRCVAPQMLAKSDQYCKIYGTPGSLLQVGSKMKKQLEAPATDIDHAARVRALLRKSRKL